MKYTDITGMPDAEIKQKISDLQEEIFNLRFQAQVGTINNPLRLRTIRRDIARMKTALRQRLVEAVPATPAAASKEGA